MNSFFVNPRTEQVLPGLDLSGQTPCLSCFIPDADLRVKQQNMRPAVLVLGGGGFDHMSIREGEPVALQFAAHGAVGFTLYYSQIPNHYPAQLLDVAYSVAYIRKNATAFHINPDKIFVCGLSAGAHPVVSLSVFSTSLTSPVVLPASCEPNGIILGYPLLSAFNNRIKCSLLGSTTDAAVTDQIELINFIHDKLPPFFIWHTEEDEEIPVSYTLSFAAKLITFDIPCELHIYSEGKHGVALGTEMTATRPDLISTACSEWIQAALRWFSERSI